MLYWKVSWTGPGRGCLTGRDKIATSYSALFASMYTERILIATVAQMVEQLIRNQ